MDDADKAVLEGIKRDLREHGVEYMVAKYRCGAYRDPEDAQIMERYVRRLAANIRAQEASCVRVYSRTGRALEL